MSLELAIRYAKKNPIRPKGRSSISRFCAILTDGYSHFRGFNSYRTSVLQAKFSQRIGNKEKICTHAEVASIVKAVRRGKVTDFSSYKMYIARVLANGEPALARPCESCMAAITEFGITEVEYTT